jgi:drug/metabolite transporter (DMT)-like permease
MNRDRSGWFLAWGAGGDGRRGPVAIGEVGVGDLAEAGEGVVELVHAPFAEVGGPARLRLGHGAVGFLLVVAPFWLTAWGQQRVPASVAAVVTATIPLFTFAFALTVLRQRPHRVAVTGLLVGAAGVVVLSGVGRASIGSAFVTGLVALLVAKASYGLGYVYIRRYLSTHPPVQVAAGSQLAAAAMLLPVLAGGRDPLVTFRAFTAGQALCLLVLGCVGTGAAQLLNYHNITRLGPTTASLATYLIPPIGLCAGVLFLGERLTASLPVGGVLILAGLYLIRRLPPTSADRPAPPEPVGRTTSPGARLRLAGDSQPAPAAAPRRPRG